MSRKPIALFLFGLIIQLILIIPTNSVIIHGQNSVPKPSVPEFTIKIVDASTYASPSYTVNPYTGENEEIRPSSVIDLEMHITIKNQRYPTIIGGNVSEFRYAVQTKGHFSESWVQGYVESISPTTFPPDGSGYTDLILPVGPLPSGAQLDVRVEAVLGNGYYTQYSGWSDKQTVTIPAVTSPTGSTTFPPSSNPTSTPTQTATENPEPKSEYPSIQPSLVIGIIATIIIIDVLVLAVTLAKRYKKGHRAI